MRVFHVFIWPPEIRLIGRLLGFDGRATNQSHFRLAAALHSHQRQQQQRRRQRQRMQLTCLAGRSGLFDGSQQRQGAQPVGRQQVQFRTG